MRHSAIKLGYANVAEKMEGLQKWKAKMEKAEKDSARRILHQANLTPPKRERWLNKDEESLTT